MLPLFAKPSEPVPEIGKILVIEDEVETLENPVLMLKLEGFKPLSAPNGRAGVRIAKRELPDAILCDVSMPELHGYGVLEALRADSNTVSIPFIFLTARTDKCDVLSCRGMEESDARQGRLV